MAPQKRTEYRNNTQGYIGVQKINRKGDEVQLAVEPFGRVFLTDEEVTLTAQVRRRAEDSPFLESEIVHRDTNTGDEIARFTAPKLERVQGAPDRPTGMRLQGEEVGTPVLR